MPPQQLRDYQRDGLNRILAAWRDGARSVLAVSPTGSGKTTIFGSLASQVPCNVLINGHRRELITQAGNRLREFGVEFGIIMAGEPRKPYARVQVASIDSLIRRKAPDAGLVINDEAHLSTADKWRKVLDQYPHARILGVTATPWRLSGKPLAGMYDACVVVATPSQLRQQGHLCDYVGFSYKAPDLSAVKTTAGDYNEQQSAEAMMGSVIVDNIVEQWLAHASDLSTVVFAVTVEHSQQLTERFRAAGVSAEHLDGTMGKIQRDGILRRVADGTTRVLCNVGVAVEGLDIPRLKCCVLARPTKSLARYLQMVGRVRRPWNGQVARIHDHAFIIKGPNGKGGHGLPDDERDYRLGAPKEDPPSMTQCEQCLAMYRGPRCPGCDHENVPKQLADRVLNTVADAEQWDFKSGEEKPLPPKPARKPIDFKWNAVGKVLEGTLLEKFEQRTEHGPRKFYRISAKRYDYTVPGYADLNRQLLPFKPGAKLRITYTGDQSLGNGKHQKIFEVQWDDGT
jgi:DNA repair protein RadD